MNVHLIIEALLFIGILIITGLFLDKIKLFKNNLKHLERRIYQTEKPFKFEIGKDLFYTHRNIEKNSYHKVKIIDRIYKEIMCYDNSYLFNKEYLIFNEKNKESFWVNERDLVLKKPTNKLKKHRAN